MSNREANLNLKQQEAVELIDGPLLILAGAGAGKTKTITHRILNIIKQGIDPRQILAITFTNKAAKEMRDRVIKLIDTDPDLNRPINQNEYPFVSTFHSLGVRILREQADKLDLSKNFSIYDRSDSKNAIKKALKAEDLNPKEHEPNKILSIISKAKGEMLTQKQYEAEAMNDYYRNLVAGVWRQYEKILKDDKALDFDDLILKTAILLRDFKEVREYYQNRWKYIHVDEYQDTNEVQYQIVKSLADRDKNICVVGDIDQNIYSWRGATIKNILHFEKDYPEATEILLEQNYRSTKTILDAANEIIKKNKMRKEKNLFTNNSDGEKIHLYHAYDENDEARFVAERVSEIIRSGTEPNEITVLYRANFQSRVIEEVLLDQRIPYQVLGVRFFDRKEIKDVLSFIKFALNPEDFNSLSRIINVPPRGIGKVTLLKVIEGKEGDLSGKARDNVASFKRLIKNIRQTIDNYKASEVIKFITQESGLENQLRNGNDDDQERLENIKELATLATKYDGLEKGEGILKLLEDAALASDQDELEKDNGGVKLMTVHASKGLEFDYVFITGLEEGLFPHENLDLKKVDDEEERRLFYVALTRARKKVFLSYSSVRTIYGSKQVNIPSEFINDIPEYHIETDDSGRQEVSSGIKDIFIDF